MAPLRSILATLTTLALGTVAVDAGRALTALAEEPLAAPVLPIPEHLPANARFIVDGATVMAVGHEVFLQRMVDRFPDLAIQTITSGTAAALEKLRQGEVDVAVIGRRLTPAERDQGLVELPISREKIALVVGPANPFDAGLTPDQLAQMFYGEIDNWAAVGGPDLPLRFVDRPASSDIRQALGQYPGFAERGLNPGSTVTTVAEDSLEAVIEALDNDGIGYAVVSQVQDRGDVRVLAVDGVLPTDARYPYSQPRVYVYNGTNPTLSALAFLGVVNAPANLAPPPAVVDPVAMPTAATATTDASGNPNPGSLGAATDQPDLTYADSPLGPGDAPEQPRPWGTQGQAWGWLIAIPLLGGLLWWLLRQPEHQAETISPGTTDAPRGRIIVTPRHCRRAYVYWEVPDELRAQQRERGGRTLTLRLFDVTDRDVERHPPSRIDQFSVTEEQQDLHIPIPADDRSYQVELGYVSQENHWLPLVKSAAVHVPACAVTPETPAVSV